MKKINNHSRDKFNSGFSLLEMMLSLSLGTLLLAAIYQVSIQLDFSLEQKREDVVNYLAEVGEYKNLYLLFDNAGLHNLNGDPIDSSSDKSKIVLKYKASAACLARVDSENGVLDNRIIKNESGGVICEQDNNSKQLIIENATISSISYMISGDTTHKWTSNPNETEINKVKGIYFNYIKEGKNYGLFAAFNTRN